MKVILLERIPNLGQMGDEINVKNGYARNFLLPTKKALRATDEARKAFETRRHEIEAQNIKRLDEAKSVSDKINGEVVIAIRQAGESGYLYGSVTTRDIVALLKDKDITLVRNQISLSQPIKMIGIHKVIISLFADVSAEISVNVARSEDEAERQMAGEVLTDVREDDEYDYSNLGAILREDDDENAEGEATETADTDTDENSASEPESAPSSEEVK